LINFFINPQRSNRQISGDASFNVTLSVPALVP